MSTILAINTKHGQFGCYILALQEMQGRRGQDFVDNLPKAVKEGIPKAECEEVLKKLEDAGASGEIK